jgi:hypothetical protein
MCENDWENHDLSVGTGGRVLRWAGRSFGAVGDEEIEALRSVEHERNVHNQYRRMESCLD